MIPAVPQSRRIIAVGTFLVLIQGISCLSLRAADDLPDETAAVFRPIDDERFAWVRRPDEWEARWSRPIAVVSPVVVAGLVAWNHAGRVHAVRVADGRPAWRSVPPHDTLFFPRASATPRGPGALSSSSSGARPSQVAAVGHLLYAVIDAEPMDPMIVCLDCSDAAEGRVAWAAGLPAGCAGFDGPLMADQGVCAVVVRAATGRGMPEVVAHDARDGVVLWRRPLGATLGRDGVDRAPDMRTARPAAGLVVVADQAGGVWAFDRSGRHAWHAAMGEPVRIVGQAGPSVIIEFGSGPKEGSLAALSAVDGRPMAAGGVGTTACGPAVMSGDAILQPAGDPTAGRLSIASIDPATLQRVGDPSPVDSWLGTTAADGAADDLVHVAVAPRILVVAGPRLLSCVGASP